MDILYIAANAALILAVGDDPGRTYRAYCTARTPNGTTVRHARMANLHGLVDRGLVADDSRLVRGRTASSLRLTPRGQAVYSMLAAIRAMPE